MSSFDTTIHALGLNLAVPAPDEADAENPMLQIVIPVGMILPVEVAPGQPLVVPVGTYRIPITRKVALDFGPKLIEEAEKLPEPKPQTDLVIPGGPVDEEALRKAQAVSEKFRGPKDT
jgi:hypothetical protein